MIVVSYRRADSAGYVRAVYERITQRVGRDNVFLDVDAIEAGRDFRAALSAAISGADALVLVIGPRWLEARAGRSRLHEPDDVVRFEIETALAEGVPVVPVLVEGVTMPAADALPPEVRPLASRNAVTISNERFDADIRRLLAVLGPRGPGVLAARIALVASTGIAIVYTPGAIGWEKYVPALFAAAGAVAASLFLVLRGSAVRWVPGGRFLVPGLSIATFSLFVLGGFTLRERRLGAPFTVTVRVTSAEPFGADGPTGEVVLDLPGDTRRRPLDANGEAVFAGLSSRVSGDSISVRAEVSGYEPAVQRLRIPPGRLIEMPLAARVYRTTVRGVVLDAGGRPLSGITLDFGGLAEAVSDALGRFTVVVPMAPGSPVVLRALRGDRTGYHERIRIPAELPLEVRFDAGG